MTDLRDKVRQEVYEALKAARELDWGYIGQIHDIRDDCADAILARVQPVVTDEMAEAASQAFLALVDPSNRWDAIGPKEQAAWTRQMKAALTAALAHAVTRDDVLEGLAVEAGDMMVAEIGGTNGGACLDLADWLRARKGGA